VLTVRPKVAELVFRLFKRPLHPELFVIHKTRRVERAGYEAKIEITSAGHLVTWRHGGLTLTEVAAEASQPLPEKRRLLCYPLIGEQSRRVDCRGVCYQVAFQLETLDPERFWEFQQGLLLDARREGMLHKFDYGGRVALGALSYINIQTRSRMLLVQAFHTFPDDLALVKSQSIFELP